MIGDSIGVAGRTYGSIHIALMGRIDESVYYFVNDLIEIYTQMQREIDLKSPMQTTIDLESPANQTININSKIKKWWNVLSFNSDDLPISGR